jgi:hypothetical protein
MAKRTSEPTNTTLGEIKVATKVCRYLEGTYTNGVVCAVKTNMRGKQKVQYTVYSILFEDNEKLNCGLETARDMHACYVSRSKARELPPDGTTKSTKSLAPDGYQLYTQWTKELGIGSPGCVPPPFRQGKNDSWLRKAQIHKYHTALNEYELHYVCGYVRYVKAGEMQHLITTSDNYRKSTLPTMVELLQYADMEAHLPPLNPQARSHWHRTSCVQNVICRE